MCFRCIRTCCVSSSSRIVIAVGLYDDRQALPVHVFWPDTIPHCSRRTACDKHHFFDCAPLVHHKTCLLSTYDARVSLTFKQSQGSSRTAIFRCGEYYDANKHVREFFAQKSFILLAFCPASKAFIFSCSDRIFVSYIQFF